MNRRSFLKHSAAASALSVLSPSLLRAAESPSFEWESLATDTGFFKMSGGTIGWMITNDSFVVMDAQFPKNAAQFLAKAREQTSRKIDLLFNTHHHGDHTKGNQILIPECISSVAHENCVKWQRLASNSPETEVVAQTTFTDEWTQSIAGETITAKYYGNAHTSGDIVIHLKNRNIAHVGDLVFNHHPPYIDQKAGANIENWALVLEKIHHDYDDDTQFIFGHGLPHAGVSGNRSDLLQMRDFLTAMLEFTQGQINEGASIDDMKNIAKLPGFEDYYMDSWASAIPDALAVAYAELAEG